MKNKNKNIEIMQYILDRCRDIDHIIENKELKENYLRIEANKNLDSFKIGIYWCNNIVYLLTGMNMLGLQGSENNGYITIYETNTNNNIKIDYSLNNLIALKGNVETLLDNVFEKTFFAINMKTMKGKISRIDR